MGDVKEGVDEVHSKLIKSVQYLTVTDPVSVGMGSNIIQRMCRAYGNGE